MFVMASRMSLSHTGLAERLMAACDLVVFSGYLIMDFKCDSFSDGSYLVYGAFARITGLVKPDYVNRIVIVFKYYFETEFACISASILPMISSHRFSILFWKIFIFR